MTDDPLPDDYMMVGGTVTTGWTPQHDAVMKDLNRKSDIRLEVAKVMIPIVISPGNWTPQQLAPTLDWWVDWITGELDG